MSIFHRKLSKTPLSTCKLFKKSWLRRSKPQKLHKIYCFVIRFREIAPRGKNLMLKTHNKALLNDIIFRRWSWEFRKWRVPSPFVMIHLFTVHMGIPIIPIPWKYSFFQDLEEGGRRDNLGYNFHLTRNPENNPSVPSPSLSMVCKKGGGGIFKDWNDDLINHLL